MLIVEEFMNLLLKNLSAVTDFCESGMSGASSVRPASSMAQLVRMINNDSANYAINI
jgi:hypothetical protein